MPTTTDRRKHVMGSQSWIAVITRHGQHENDPDGYLEHETMKHRTFQTRAAAERFLAVTMPALNKSTTWDVTGDIYTGTWEADDYQDEGYGMILDAQFIEADLPRAYAQVTGTDVEIEWTEA